MLLIDLDPSDCKAITDYGFKALETMSSLTKLNLRNIGEGTDVGLRTIAALTALVSLGLRQCCKIANPGVVHLAPLRFLTHLDKAVAIW